MSEVTCCPECGSDDVLHNPKRNNYRCEGCGHRFTVEKPFMPKRVFISYGHDEHMALALRLREDLKKRGHEVWFDADRLPPGQDWELNIEKGLEWAAADKANAAVILLLTPYSVRRPDGYCLNEVARALSRGLQIIPLMVVESEPPLSICRIQWLDMKECIPIHEKGEQYQLKFERLLEALEEDRLDFEGMQQRLLRCLRPLEFDTDILYHVEKFTGRQWIFNAVRQWLDEPSEQRVFWICGGPGVGKTALSAILSSRYREVVALHLCKFGHAQKSDPRSVVTSIVYQLSTQLPDYEARLTGMDLEILTQDDAGTMFDNLVVQPLLRLNNPNRAIIILIDALDEASSNGYNQLAAFIANEFPRTPEWLRLVITSRPENAVTSPLQGLNPFIINTETEDNREDIRNYLCRELSGHLRTRDSTSNVIEQILDRSEGVFLYVERVCHDLRSGNLSLDRLGEFPRGLSQVFLQFFNRLVWIGDTDKPRPDYDQYRREFRPPLRAILAAREPLPTEILQQLFGWKDEELRDTIRLLGSFFPVSEFKGREVIQPCHKALSDWLQDQSKSSDYHVSTLEGDRVLAELGWRSYSAGVSSLDSYFISHLPAHLSNVGRANDLSRLLLDFDFLQRKLEELGFAALTSDFGLVHHAADSTIGRLERVIRLSAHALSRDPDQLASQLLGRLATSDDLELSSLLTKKKTRTNARLRPITASLTTPEDSLVFILTGHERSVRDVAITPDGRRAVSASSDKTLRIWNLESGIAERILRGHSDSVTAVVTLADSRRAISCSSDHTLRVWKLDTGETLQILAGHTNRISAVSVFPDNQHAISCSYDHTLRVWDLESGVVLRVLHGHEHWVDSVALTPDGKQAISASHDRTLRIWNLETGECLRSLNGHTHQVVAVRVHSDGVRVLSASYDKTLRLWNLSNGELLRTFDGHTHWVSAVELLLDGRRAVSASDDTTLRIWDLDTGRTESVLSGHEKAVRAIALLPDGKRLVSGSEDNTLRVWSTDTGDTLQKLRGHTHWIGCVAVLSHDKCVISGSGDHTLRIWFTERNRTTSLVDRHSDWVKSVALLPDGQTAISASCDNTLRSWNMDTGRTLNVLRGHTDSVVHVLVHPDGRRTISASNDHSLRVWDLTCEKESLVLRGHTNWISRTAILSDGRRAVTSSGDRTLRIWDLETGETLRILQGHSGSVDSFRVVPDDSRLVSVSGDLTLRVWDLDTGATLRVLSGHTKPISALAIARDGRYLVSGSWDSTLRIWDLEHGNEIHLLSGHVRPVRTLAILPNQRQVISASADQTLRVWDVNTGESVTELRGHGGAVSNVKILPDGDRAISVSADHTLRLWDLGSGQTVHEFRGHKEAIHAISILPGARHMITGAGDYSLRLWDLAEGSNVATFTVDEAITCLEYSARLETVIVGGIGGSMHFVRIEM